jgi:DUF438 domain-containing protein
MDMNRNLLETMHEEHVATQDHLELLMQAIRAPRTARDAALPRYGALLRTLLADLETNVEGHFRFEERHLFPLLREAGEAELADALTLEHVAIRNATMPVLGYLRDALAANPSDREWTEFGELATKLIEMNRAHMAREEAQMVPLLRKNLP